MGLVADRAYHPVMWAFFLLSVGSLLLIPRDGLAHVTQAPDGVAVLSDGALAAVETTVGLLVSMDGGLGGDSLRWVCHEALSSSDAVRIPRYVRLPDGAFLATIRTLELGVDPDASVYRSDDGCTWEAVSGLAGEVISELAVGSDGQVLATAANLGAGAINRLFLSADGRSFTATSLARDDLYLLSVAWAGPSARAYVGGARLDPPAAVLLVSDPPFEVVAERLLPAGDEAEQPLVLATDPIDADLAVLRLDGLTRDRVLVTTDGGATFVEIVRWDGDVLDATLLPGGELLVVRSDGAALRGPLLGPWEVDEALPSLRGTTIAGGRHLLALDNQREGAVLGELDGAGFTPLFAFRDLQDRLRCPAATRVEVACAPLWESMQRLIGIYADPDPTPPTFVDRKDGCGDASGGAALLFGLHWGLLRRRGAPSRQPGVPVS